MKKIPLMTARKPASNRSQAAVRKARHPLTNKAQIKASVTVTRVTATRKAPGTQGRSTLTDILLADMFS